MKRGNKMVILYSTGCPNCIELEEMLKDKNIDYQKVSDIPTMLEKGIERVPVLEVNDVLMQADQARTWVITHD